VTSWRLMRPGDFPTVRLSDRPTGRPSDWPTRPAQPTGPWGALTGVSSIGVSCCAYRWSRGACYDDDVTRTTITIDEKTLDDLHRLAAERGISVAAFVREALEEKMERCEHERPRRRELPRSIGSGDSGTTDLSRVSGEVPAVPYSWR